MPRSEGRRRREDGPDRGRAVLPLAGLAVCLVIAAALPWWVPAVPHLLQRTASMAPHHQVPGAVARTPAGHPPTPARIGPPLPASAQVRTGRLAGAGTPVRIVVPRLHVDSEVVPVTGEGGTLVPPPDPVQLGWWREGAVPGAARGHAVLTGHTVHTGGGALDHLDQLVAGDRLEVWTRAGTIRYAVEGVRVLPTRMLARQAHRIFSTAGPGRLVLVTCDDWNGSTYLSNAVVTAYPVSSRSSRARP